jgi:hypothetical protein
MSGIVQPVVRVVRSSEAPRACCLTVSGAGPGVVHITRPAGSLLLLLTLS